MLGIDIEAAVNKKHNNNPRFAYQWVVELPSLTTNTSIDSPVLSNYINKLPSVTRSLLLSSKTPNEVSQRVYSVENPFLSYNIEQVPYQTLGWKYASEASIPDLQLSIEEYEDELTLQYLMAWRNLIRNEDGTLNPAGVYKKDIYVHRIDANNRVTGSTKFIDCIVKDISPISYSYDTDDIVEYKVSLSVDDIRENLSGTSAGNISTLNTGTKTINMG